MTARETDATPRGPPATGPSTSGTGRVSEPHIERRAARMTAVATVRQLLALPLGLASAVTVARFYGPAELGRFAVLSFVVTLPALVGDLGLTQAFIRRPGDPGPRETALAASLQLWIAAAALPLILAGIRLADARADLPWIALAAVLYLPTLLAAFVLRANVLVARRLDFARLALLDLGQQVCYIALLLWLGIEHAGVAGLIVATTAGQLLRLGVLIRWYPGAPAAVPSIRPLVAEMKNGLPLHLTGIASGFHSGLLNWLGAPLFGPVAVGYLRWSQDMTNRVGTGLAHAIGSVVYPTIALLQEDAGRLGRVVARAVRYNVLLIGLPLALLAGLAAPVISAIFGGRWLPASAALQVFAAFAVGTAVVVPLDAAVRVVRPTIWSLQLMLGYLAAEVLLALALARATGLLAIPLAHLVATAGLVALLRALLPPAARPATGRDIVLPALAVIAAFLASRLVAVTLTAWPALFAGSAAGAVAAAAVVFTVGRRSIAPELLGDIRRLRPAAGAAHQTS